MINFLTNQLAPAVEDYRALDHAPELLLGHRRDEVLASSADARLTAALEAGQICPRHFARLSPRRPRLPAVQM